MKKIYTLACMLTLGLTATAQQTQTESVVFTTGGSFAAPNNLVRVYQLNTITDELDTLGAFYGDFSNDVITHGTQAYVHVGRAASNPRGADVIYRVDLITGNVEDSTQVNTAGLQEFVIHEDQLIYSRGFGATGNYLAAKSLTDLSVETFLDTGIPSSVGGIASNGSELIVSFTQNDSGYIGVYDLSASSISFNRWLPLDTLSSGIGNISVIDETVYAISDSWTVAYNGLSEVDLATNTFSTDTAINASGKIFLNTGDELYANFGGGVDILDLSTNQVSNWAATFPTSVSYDSIGDEFYLQRTDYSSFGNIARFNSAGNTIENWSTSISGTASAITYNNSPVAVAQQTWSIDQPLDTFYLNIQENDFMDSYHLSVNDTTNLPSISSIGDSALVHNQMDGEITGTKGITLFACDEFGFCTTIEVTIISSLSVQNQVTESLTMYPNPASNVVRFSAAVDQVRLVNLNGAVVFEGVNLNTIDVSTMAKGMYIVETVSSDQKQQQKLIIK